MVFNITRTMVILLALAMRLATAGAAPLDGVFDVPANVVVRFRLEQGLTGCPENVYLGFDNRTCSNPAHGASMRKVANIWTAWGVVGPKGGTASSNNTYSINTFEDEKRTYKCLGTMQPTNKATCSSSSVTIVPSDGDGDTASWEFIPVEGSPGVYNIINVVTKKGAPSCRRFLTAPASCSVEKVSLRPSNTVSRLQKWILVPDTTDQPPSPSTPSPETPSPPPTLVSPSPLPAPTAPSAPRDVTAAWSLTRAALILTWSPPQSTGGAPLLGYSVSCVSAGGAPVDVSPNTLAADTLTTAPDGLRGPWLPDVPYTCYVVAKNSAGSSVPSTLSNEFMVVDSGGTRPLPLVSPPPPEPPSPPPPSPPPPPPSWVTVGNAGFSAGNAYYTSLALDSSGNPVVAYADGANSGKLTVMKYTSAAGWEPVGNAGFSAGTAAFVSLALDSFDNPVVAYSNLIDFVNSEATVMKHTSASGWEPVGSAGFSAGNAYYTSLALDSSGNPFVAYQDGSNSGKATVMKHTSASGWVTVGNAEFSAGPAVYTSLALDSSGNPFVAYRDEANGLKATVMKYTSASGWVPVGNAGFSVGFAGATTLALDSSENPFVAYSDSGTSGKATVMKYTSAPGWEPVGNAGFSAAGAQFNSLALDSSGNPVVAYTDGGNSFKVTVMKHTSTSGWEPVGSAGFSAGNAYYTSLALDSSGNPLVAYLDVANSNKATVMKYY